MNISIDIENLTLGIASVVKGLLEDATHNKHIGGQVYDTIIDTEGEAARHLKLLVSPIRYMALDEGGVEQEERELMVSVSLAKMQKDTLAAESL